MRTFKELKKELGVEEEPRVPARRRDPDAHLGATEVEAESSCKAHSLEAPPVVDGSALILPAGVLNRKVIDEWLRRSDCLLDIVRH